MGGACDEQERAAMPGVRSLASQKGVRLTHGVGTMCDSDSQLARMSYTVRQHSIMTYRNLRSTDLTG